MTITKFGHCCLLIEEQGLRILTDPGNYTTEQNGVKDITVVLITHEHGDHFHVESLKEVLANNPTARVITNRSVGKLLDEAGIPYTVLEHRQSTDIQGILVEAFGDKHHIIYKTLDLVQNTGFFIAGKLFYPGDAFTNPGKPIDILALPVNGPWMTAAEAFDYAQEVRPRVCFPVHDGNMMRTATIYRLSTNILKAAGVTFVPLELNKKTEL